MKKICFIAQFPPPIHGLSKAVQTLYDSESKMFEYEKIDIKNNKIFLFNLIKILLSNADLYYFTISQTKGGNIRDLIILNLIRQKKKKYIIHLHGGSFYREMIEKQAFKIQRRINYKYIKDANQVIVLSESLKETFKDMIDEKKIKVVANCVDNEFVLTDEEFKEKHRKISKKKVKNILYLSNFIKEKGYLHVLDIAKLENDNLKKTGTQRFKVYFAGKFFDKREEEKFLEDIKELQLENIVEYCGIVKGKDKRELLKKTDIMILLTTYFREGQPISIIEGMANGNVIISTNHTSIPDMIKNEINGLIIDKKNIDSNTIYRKIMEMSDIEYERISKENYKRSALFSEEEYIRKMHECFEKCIFKEN